MSAIKVIGVETVTVVEKRKARMSRNPYIRATQRMCVAVTKGQDVEKVTMTRLNRCTRPAKIAGIFLAAKDLDLKSVARAARAKYKELTGFNPS